MSAAAEFFKETVNTTGEIAKNLPAGQKINVQTDADITIAFWNPASGAFGATEAVTAPGATFRCPNERGRIIAATSANVTITLAND